MPKSKDSVKARVNFLFNHYFHFFEIPDFIPLKLFKKLWKRWKLYFIKRDDLDTLIEDKDQALDDLDIYAGYIKDDFEALIKNTDDAADNVNKLISDFTDDYADLTLSGLEIQNTLNQIISNQNNYKWYEG